MEKYHMKSETARTAAGGSLLNHNKDYNYLLGLPGQVSQIMALADVGAGETNAEETLCEETF